MMPREKWTDDRLDDLSKKVDVGFADTKAVIGETKAEMSAGFTRVDTEIHDLRSEMNARFEKVDDRFDKLNDSMNTRFESLNRNLQATMVAVIVALIGSNAF